MRRKRRLSVSDIKDPAPEHKFANRIGKAALRDGEALLYGQPLRFLPQQALGAPPYWLALRPEKIRIRRSGEHEDDPEVNSLTATAREAIFQGDSLLVLAALPDGQVISVRLVAQEGNRANTPAPGETIRLDLHRNDTVVVTADA